MIFYTKAIRCRGPPVSSIIDRWRLRKKTPKTFWCCWKQAGRQQYIASLLLVLSECKIAFQKSFLPPDIVWNKTWLFSKVLRRERLGRPNGLWPSISRLKVKAPTMVARNNGDESSSQVRFRVRKFGRTPPNTMLWNACRFTIHLCWWWLRNKYMSSNNKFDNLWRIPFKLFLRELSRIYYSVYSGKFFLRKKNLIY